MSLTFFLSSWARRLSRIGRLLTELDGKDDMLPYLLLLNLGSEGWYRPLYFFTPRSFRTSEYMVSNPSSCFLIARASLVLISPSESLCPSNIDSKSSDLVVVEVKSVVSKPKTTKKL